METRNPILSELQAISRAVAEINPHNVYQVPPGYFEGLAETILNRLKTNALDPKEELETISPLLNSLSRKLPYEVPQGFFSELADSVVGGVKAIDFVKREMQNISPLMDNLRHKQTYQVPAGYFDTLAGNILNKIKSEQRQPAKVVSMGRRVMRVAVAALVAGVMAIGAWLYFGTTSGPEVASAGIEKISDDNKISDEEMTRFLENESLTASVSTAAFDDSNIDMDEADIKEMLSDVSDDELQQYLTTL